ncbi:hypothetical protein [Thioalkalivibrio sp. ALE11]|uniref:hypothetical protein n=1 Tax=Thioalkalivibrio sp. ALE11 TaxID=1265494 RepID=UPI00035C6BB3|nr:hypothetical protein [Thioalkalivibrio sp. ALE11]
MKQAVRRGNVSLVVALVLILAGALITWIWLERWQAGVLGEHETLQQPVAASDATAHEMALEATLRPGLVAPSYTNMIERPLFMSTRRPPVDDPPDEDPEPEVEEPEQPPDPLEATLRSVLVVGEARYAWLEVEGAARELRLAPGEEIEGWSLDVIEPSFVEFTAGDSRKRLELRPSGSVGDPAEPVRSRPRARD